VTPLVDIMLVLLIIFLVTARLAVTPPKGLPLDLPRSASAETIQLVFAVALYADGQTTVNGETVADDPSFALPEHAPSTKPHPDLRAVVQADAMCSMSASSMPSISFLRLE